MRAAVARSFVAVALLAAAACGGRERDTLDGDAIGSLLSALGADSVLRLTGGDTLRVSAATLEFYGGRRGRAAWVGPEGPLEQATALHDAIGHAVDDGLPPARYRHDVATELFTALAREDDAELADTTSLRYLADLDVLLSEGFNRLARDLVLGMMDPMEAGLDYRIPAEAAPQSSLLDRVIGGETPAALVVELRPSMPQYERMRVSLAAFRAAESRVWPRIQGDSTMKEGARGESVAQLRARLSAGVDAEEAALAATGAADPTLFDADLARAVESFQERHALEPDGAIGATTARELNHTAAEWTSELQLNLDRWRWLPNQLGERYVLVNIAGFELEVVDQGRVIEAMNVVVGQLDLQTPIFADSIRHVVVNPYWNVPDGIMERKIRPGIAADPNYLAKHDMEIVDGRVRQRPGPQNSLGRYKFIFPNEFDVYLHDTPQGELFARTQRAFSSGCVRIERPRDFARMLLTLQSSQDPESLDALVAAGSEQWIKLDRPLPVFLLYFTGWAQEDGTVRFHHDVYGRDEAMGDQAEEMEPPAGLPRERE